MTRAAVLPFEFSDFAGVPATREERAPAAASDGGAIERARAEGFAEGVEAGRRASEAEGAAALTAIAQSLSAAHAEGVAALDAERRRLGDLAAAFLTRFTEGLSAAREVDIATRLLDRLIAASDDRAPARLFLNPASLGAHRAVLASALDEKGVAGFVELSADASLDPGECRLAWRGGEAMRRLNPALAELDDALRGDDKTGPDHAASWRPLKLSMETGHERY